MTVWRPEGSEAAEESVNSTRLRLFAALSDRKTARHVAHARAPLPNTRGTRLRTATALMSALHHDEIT